MRSRALRRRLARYVHGSTAPVEVRALPERGRGVIATAGAAAGATVHAATPMSQVLKHQPANGPPLCRECFRPLPSGADLCCSACEASFEARGGSLLARVDLSAMMALTEGRNFPLHVASLLAGLLAEVRACGGLPQVWAPLDLCFAELEPESHPQTDKEHAALASAFVAAGVTNQQTLELLLPLSRYRRLLGAAQLNAFELRLSHGAVVSALLPGVASCFNHSCEPNVLISCGESTHVAFVAGGEVCAGAELLINYVDYDSSREDRRHLLRHKYGFDCNCVRCASGL